VGGSHTHFGSRTDVRPCRRSRRVPRREVDIVMTRGDGAYEATITWIEQATIKE
jgi:hypothetical protein